MEVIRVEEDRSLDMVSPRIVTTAIREEDLPSSVVVAIIKAMVVVIVKVMVVAVEEDPSLDMEEVAIRVSKARDSTTIEEEAL